MKYLVYFLLIITVFFVLMLALALITQSARNVKERLGEIRGYEQESEDEFKKPFVERALLPLYEAIYRGIDRLTPERVEEYYRGLILQAGLQDKSSPIRVLVNQTLFSLVAGSMIFMLSRFSNSKLNIPLILVAMGASFFYPLSHLSSLAKVRKEKIRKNLPDLLDMLYISVEAGLSFDSAIKQTALKMKGPLSDEILLALSDITKGKEREEALRSIGQRSQVEDVSTFITAVIQSELLGSNMANMLRIQSNTMRQKRRQRAEEQAMKIPVKMLFPMVFFMLPALFVIILGPAAINIVKMFMSM